MPSDPRDYKIDVAGVTPTQGGATTPKGRPFLAVHFACCGVYQRVYRHADGVHYRGRCPRCTRPVSFAIGEGGTSARAFRVS